MTAGDFLVEQDLVLRPDPSRVVLRPFKPATEPRGLNPTDRTRADKIVQRIQALDVAAAQADLDDIMAGFGHRHRDVLAAFDARADEMEPAFSPHPPFTEVQRRLVGAYFLHEYSFEAAALFNPSMVAHPDQSGLEPEALRFVMSLRAVGEGHVSSLTFRSGVVTADGRVRIDRAGRGTLEARLQRRTTGPGGDTVKVAFPPDVDLGERVIFPVTMPQMNGIEDARFVLFEDEGERAYYATYTAYSGKAIRSELLRTEDFLTFTLSPLQGSATHNKGMALFPRKLGGRYAMIGRQDNENLFLIYSDDLHVWNDGTVIVEPRYPWEFVQLGNSGAPIEIDQGWLVLTHGVGPVRRYTIGAVLLDRDDPSKVLARSRVPLIEPQEGEREGYVPNVVYTCGALVHSGRLVLPYAVADSFTRVATIGLDALLASLDG
ncbi:MAG: glycoside hydrolase family 130 protein [Geminicoccaceae bacterium]